LRSFEYENFERDEVECVDDSSTKLYNEGKILVGLTPEDAKPKPSLLERIEDAVMGMITTQQKINSHIAKAVNAKSHA
jgi:hypothetical protein